MISFFPLQSAMRDNNPAAAGAAYTQLCHQIERTFNGLVDDLADERDATGMTDAEYNRRFRVLGLHSERNRSRALSILLGLG